MDVAVYRLGLRVRLHPVLKVVPMAIPEGAFFENAHRQGSAPPITPAWQGRPWAFGKPVGPSSENPPDWHADIFTSVKIENVTSRWDRISLGSNHIDDIKTIWEASRLDWVLAFAQGAASGQAGALDKLNSWLADWNLKNPAYCGPNWICGQEASIRVMHLVLAAIILSDEDEISAPLEMMLMTHLRRIAKTTSYARGQDNNHATSEATALYAAGLWLSKASKDAGRRSEALGFMDSGMRLAEDRVRKLIFSDGGFAQYSPVYHRLMLDSLSVMELARRRFSGPL